MATALTNAQRKLAQQIYSQGRQRHESAKEILAALETGWVEARYSNPNYGDGTSLGWRQETASSYPNVNRRDLTGSINRFYDETSKVENQYGHSGALAQAVQRSAYPGKYQAAKGVAGALFREFKKSGGAIPSADSSAPAAATTTSGGGLQQAEPGNTAVADALIASLGAPARAPLGALPGTAHMAAPVLPSGARVVAPSAPPQPRVSIDDVLSATADLQGTPPQTNPTQTTTTDTGAAQGVTAGVSGGRHRATTGGIVGRKTLGRTDQGVDFTGTGAIPAYGDGVVTRVVPHGGPSGWPGGGFLVIRLDNPPDAAHRFVYVAENISPTVRAGQRVRAGQKVAHAHGGYPFIETGWAADAHGTTLSSARGTQNRHPNHSNTPEGISFLRWLGLA